jgi:hypothetical protein
MSPARRLKIRTTERHPQRDGIRLVFARADYDCRREIPRYGWRAVIADRIKVKFKI